MRRTEEGISEMQLCHTPAALSAVFDEPNLIASAGLVPGVALADRIGLRALADEWLTVPGSTGCAGAKVMSLVVGMLAGADSIDDLDLLRHGGMNKVFGDVRAPSTLGSFLRSFTFGHVRQLDAVASRTLIGLAEVVPGLLAGGDGTVMLDIDDTVKPVFGATKQGAQHGYTKVKGLNAQVATISTPKAAPVIAAARLRRGAAASAHGAVRLVRDAVSTTRRAGVTGQILVRTDSAFFQHAFVTAVMKSGAWFSVGARQDTAVRRAIASIDEASWVRIEYLQAVLDSDTGELVSAAEVAEVPYLAFTSHRTPVQGRLIVRRVPERNTTKLADAAQQGLFPVWRYHAIFTNNPSPLVEAESQHRGHAIVEQVIADLKAGPLAHLPSKSWRQCAAGSGCDSTRNIPGAQGCALTATQRYPRDVMIVDVDPERLREVCERYGVASLEVFGSAARNEDRRDSDVDLLYVLKPDARLGFSLFDLEDELAVLFGRPVDLVSRKAINKYIREQVLADAQPLYAA